MHKQYQINPAAGAKFTLEVGKTGILSGKRHLFLFERYRGSIELDPGQPEAARVGFAVEAGSAVCQDAWVGERDRRKILREALAQVMRVEQYPELSFASTGVRVQTEARYEVLGGLTVRDVTKPVRIEVSLEPGWGEQVQMMGRARVRLSDYGIKPPATLLGLVGTKDEMIGEFLLVAIKEWDRAGTSAG